MRLHRHIQRTDRFIGHDQGRPSDQGPRNGDALALAPRKFMRVFVQIGRPQAHFGQGLRGAVSELRPSIRSHKATLNGLGHDVQHFLPRVERAIGVLEHHLKPAAQGPQLGGRQLVNVLPLKQHLTGCGRVQCHDQAGQCGLARTRLAHHAQTFAGLQCETDIGQSLQTRGRAPQLRARQRKAAPQLLDLQERRGRVQHGAHDCLQCGQLTQCGSAEGHFGGTGSACGG